MVDSVRSSSTHGAKTNHVASVADVAADMDLRRRPVSAAAAAAGEAFTAVLQHGKPMPNVESNDCRLDASTGNRRCQLALRETTAHLVDDQVEGGRVAEHHAGVPQQLRLVRLPAAGRPGRLRIVVCRRAVPVPQPQLVTRMPSEAEGHCSSWSRPLRPRTA